MPEETPQLPASPSRGGPVSEQEIQIEAPSFKDKLKLQKKKILIGLGVFFGVLILAGTVFGIYRYAQRQISLEELKPTPLPAEVSTEEGDPTADWQIYTNEEYGYSIKYPPDWFIEEKEDLTKIYNQDPNIYKFERTREISSGVFDYPIEDFIFDIDVIGVTPEPNLAQRNSVNIGGASGITGILTGGEGEKILMAHLVKSAETYNFYGRPADSNYKDKFNLILSTFKFLEEESCGGMTLTEAKEIALVSECVEEGILTDNSFCNDSTNTWWIDLDIDRPGCAPACVINVSTKKAEINWRCTGLIPD